MNIIKFIVQMYKNIEIKLYDNNLKLFKKNSTLFLIWGMGKISQKLDYKFNEENNKNKY